MKNVLMTIMLVSISILSFAQQDSTNTLKGQKGDWGFSINISGIINDIKIENNKDAIGNYKIFARKYIKDDVALRVGFNATTNRIKGNKEDSISLGSGNRALQAVDSSYSRFDFSVSLGYEKHLKGTKRLDPYVAGELMIGRMGNTKIDVNTDITDVTGTDKTQQIIQYDGGFVFGLGAIAGFNYFIAQKFSLGAEFGYMYQYTKAGGDWSESIVNTPVSGSQSSTFNLGKQSQSQNFIGVATTGNIILSYFF